MRAVLFHIFITLAFLSVPAVFAETLTVAVPINSRQERYAYKAVADFFSQAHPEYKIDYYAYEPPTYYSKLPDMLSGKKPADIVFLRAGHPVKSLASENKLVPLSGLWGRVGRASFTKEQQEMVKYKEQYYAIPFSKYTYGLFYNKNIFLKYGLEAPKTWEDFILVCEQLKKYGYFPISVGGSNTSAASDWFSYIMIKQHGREFYDSFMSGKVSMFDKRTEKSLETMQSLSTNGYLLPNYDKMTEKNAAAYLLREKAGMMLLKNSYGSSLPANVRKMVEFVPFPTINNTYATDEGVFLNTFAMTKSAANKQSAKLFLAFILRSDTQSLINKLMLTIPSNSDSMVDEDCRFIKSGKAILQKSTQYSMFSPSDAVWENNENLNRELNKIFLGTEIKIILHRLEAKRLERAVK